MQMDRLALRVQTAPAVRRMTIVAASHPDAEADGTWVLSGDCQSEVDIVSEVDRMIRDLERIKRVARAASARAFADAANPAKAPAERLV
jgi:hypothetical protein